MNLPKVTILTPTKDRPGFLAQCARYVAAQTYPKDLLEWVIVDSGNDTLYLPDIVTDVRTVLINRKGVTGQLRNAGLRVATGDIIVHFDDDDWSSADRIEKSVKPFLTRPTLELVCTDNYYVGMFEETPFQAFRTWSWDQESCSSGATFAYRKETWKKTPFPAIPVGEDQVFARAIRARSHGAMLNLRDSSIFVYVRHAKNSWQCDIETWMKLVSKDEYTTCLRTMMGEDFDHTVELCSAKKNAPPPKEKGAF